MRFVITAEHAWHLETSLICKRSWKAHLNILVKRPHQTMLGESSSEVGSDEADISPLDGYNEEPTDLDQGFGEAS